MSERTLESLITNISKGLSQGQLHPVHSSVVEQIIRSALTNLGSLCKSARSEQAEIRMRSGEFVGEHGLLIGATISGYRLIEVLRRSSASGLVIGRTAREEDFRGFLRFGIELPPGAPLSYEEAKARLLACDCRMIQLVRTDEKVTWFQSETSSRTWSEAGIELGPSVGMFQSMFENVEDSMRLAASGDSIDINDARTISEQMRQTSDTGFDNLFQLANYSNYDSYTVGHSIRVAMLAVYVASRLNVPPEQLTEIGAAGLMHDVGKGRIPHEILYKPARLDEEERRIISKHPALGAEILIEAEDPSPCALGAAWGHHLRHDGAGYPAVSRWFERTRTTSLIHVCDVFEALTAERPYKPAMTPGAAYRIMFGQEGTYDPGVLRAFARTMGLYPPGSFVRLSDGRIGRVYSPGEAIDRPAVRLLPGGPLVDLEQPEWQHLSVSALTTDSEALRELEQDEPPAPLPSQSQTEEAAPTPEELHSHTEHDDDCRLC